MVSRSMSEAAGRSGAAVRDRGRAKARLVDLAVAALDAVDGDAAFPASAVLGLLSEQLDAPGAVAQRIDWASGRSEIVLHGYPGAWVPRLQEATRTLRHSHPLLLAHAAGDLRPATAQEAAGGWTAWQRSPSRDFLTELVSWPQLVSMGLRGSHREVFGLAFARSGRDFTAADVAFLAEVQPVLQALDRHLSRLCVGRATCPAGQGWPTPALGDSGLTGRELEVLLLLGEGLTAAAVARRLCCSPRTVHQHIGRIFHKLEVHDRLGAVLEAQRRGLLPVPVRADVAV